MREALAAGAVLDVFATSAAAQRHPELTDGASIVTDDAIEALAETVTPQGLIAVCAARANGMTYNRLIQGLKLAGVEVDRKILADLAVTDEAAFAAIVEVARAAVAAEGTGGSAAA